MARPPVSNLPNRILLLQKNPPATEDECDGDGRLRRLFSRFSPRRSGEWVADFGRFWWALASLNLRKTLSRARGGRPPCQNPSDSGRAWETGCDGTGAFRLRRGQAES